MEQDAHTYDLIVTLMVRLEPAFDTVETHLQMKSKLILAGAW